MIMKISLCANVQGQTPSADWHTMEEIKAKIWSRVLRSTNNIDGHQNKFLIGSLDMMDQLM